MHRYQHSSFVGWSAAYGVKLHKGCRRCLLSGCELFGSSAKGPTLPTSLDQCLDLSRSAAYLYAQMTKSKVQQVDCCDATRQRLVVRHII